MSKPSKTDRVFSVLRRHIGKFVAMPVLARAANTYVVHSEIDRCRRKFKATITNERDRHPRTGDTRSWYRLDA